MPTPWYPGPPGITAPVSTGCRAVFLQQSEKFIAQGRRIDGNLAADPGNAPDIAVLRPGVLMGKITATGLYANSFFDTTAGAITSSGTSFTLSPAGAVELVRRVGASGTVSVTGPAAASGTARTMTGTYSSVNTTTGVVTTTAMGVNEVQTLNFANSPAGTFQLTVVDANGVAQETAPITYSATIGTLLTNINNALNTVLGSSMVVASGTLVTAVALTFSGAGYAATPQPLSTVNDGGLSAGTVAISRTTAGQSGAFVAGSLIGPGDGSQVPTTFIPDWTPGLQLTDGYGNRVTSIDFPMLPVWGVIDQTQLLPWPTDTGLQAFIKNSLSSAWGGKFTFNDQY